MSHPHPIQAVDPVSGEVWGTCTVILSGDVKGGRTYCEVDRKWTIWILSLACKSKYHQLFLCALRTMLTSLEARQGKPLQNFVTSEEGTEAQDWGSYLRPAGLTGGEEGGWIPRALTSRIQVAPQLSSTESQGLPSFFSTLWKDFRA